MVDDVKKCVDARVGFFAQYFDIPQQMQEEVDSFIRDTNALGEKCADAGQFEAEFAATGLSDRFNAILPRCTQKQRKMTKEEKQASRKIAKEILYENRQDLAKSALDDAMQWVRVEAEDELTTRNRERMIEEGTFDDYTIAHNIGDTVGSLLGGLFRKKDRK